ncbi:MAG: 16S rRNA (cytidine(1402)-2'-O)-methyltransferase [Fimbriimonadaceae bacterium]
MIRTALTLVATPIGNLGDLSPRAAEALVNADFWFVEDSRVSGKLATHLGVRRPMRLVTDHTDDPTLQRYVDDLASAHGALITDGGAPGVSDPGARLCDLCYAAGLQVDAVPGPSAVIDALMLSGFYAQRFVFLGFLGRKHGAIVSDLATFANSPLTVVLFESPHRFRALLTAAHAALGERRYAVCRELTKLHQQVFRGVLPCVPSEGEVPAKGEVTVVIEGLRRPTRGAKLR